MPFPNPQNTCELVGQTPKHPPCFRITPLRVFFFLSEVSLHISGLPSCVCFFFSFQSFTPCFRITLQLFPFLFYIRSFTSRTHPSRLGPPTPHPPPPPLLASSSSCAYYAYGFQLHALLLQVLSPFHFSGRC